MRPGSDQIQILRDVDDEDYDDNSDDGRNTGFLHRLPPSRAHPHPHPSPLPSPNSETQRLLPSRHSPRDLRRVNHSNYQSFNNYNSMSSSTPSPQAAVDICDKGDDCDCGLHSRRTEDDSCCRDLVLQMPTPRMSRRRCLKGLKDFFPVLDWGPNYSLADLQGDAIAGITVALTVIPQGLAYASVAGLEPQYGLYSAFMGCFVYVFLGTAKDITFGPTAIMSLMVGQFGKGDIQLAVTMTLIAGLIQFAMGVLKLGVLIDFISFPVISAFTSAAAVTIATTQLKSLLGLKNVPNEFLEALEHVIWEIKETQFGDLTIGLISIVVLYAMKRVKSLKWTEACLRPDADLTRLARVGRRAVWLACTARNAIVVLVTGVVCYCIEAYHGTDAVAALGISLTPNVEPGMPPVAPPRFRVQVNGTEMDALQEVGVGYLVVALIGILESIAIGKAFARLGCYKVRPSQEMIAMGVANVISSFFSSFPITGSFSRTAVNYQTGVRTPLGGAFTGAVVLLALGLLASLFRYIPKAALAAVIISSVIPMFDYAILVRFFRVIFRRHLTSSPLFVFLYHLVIDVLPWAGTFFGSLFLGLEWGILIGVGISMLPMLWLIARPPVEKKNDLDNLTQRSDVLVVVLKPKFGMSFPAAEEFAELANDAATVAEEEEEEVEEEEPGLSPLGRDSKRKLSVRPKTVPALPINQRRHVIVDGSQVVTLDFSVLQMLSELAATQRRFDRLLVLCSFDHRGAAMLDAGLEGMDGAEGVGGARRCADLRQALEIIERFDGEADTPLVTNREC